MRSPAKHALLAVIMVLAGSTIVLCQSSAIYNATEAAKNVSEVAAE